ncbi:hypothetical protein D3C81_1322270 [compost metagenome]
MRIMRDSWLPASKLASLSQVPALRARHGVRPITWSRRVRLPAGTVRSFSTVTSAAVIGTKAATLLTSTTTGCRVRSSAGIDAGVATTGGVSVTWTTGSGAGWRLNETPQYPAMMAPIKNKPARPRVIRLFMTALPFLLLQNSFYLTRKLRNQAAMNIGLFRYLTVAQVEQNAITERKK